MIDSFEGKYAFLSNFYESPIEEDRIIYPTVEHYFQAQKTLDIEKKRRLRARLLRVRQRGLVEA